MVRERGEHGRFEFNDGSPMNPFWTWKTMTPLERGICFRLARRAGPLGWNKRSFSAAHVPMGLVEAVVEQGLIRKVPLLQLAREITTNETFIGERQELESQGGFLAARVDDRRLIFDFDWASSIVAGRCDPDEASETRYQIVDQNLHDYINMLLD